MSSTGTSGHGGHVWKFVYSGTLPTLNEYLAAAGKRTRSYQPDNEMKQKYTLILRNAINQQPRPRPAPFRRPVYISYVYYEPNRRRDKDNVAAVAHKFIQDALIEAGILAGDGWKYVEGFDDTFFIDKAHPHIDVVLRETDGK